MEADLRFATTDEERAAVYELRYELYVEGQGLFVDEADHERGWLTDEYDEGSRIGVAEVGGRVVGTVRVTWGAEMPFTEESREAYDVGRFAGIVEERDMIVATRLLVREEFRGGVLALKLLWMAYEFAAVEGVELILGNCEPHLVNRYWTLGFRPFGNRT